MSKKDKLRRIAIICELTRLSRNGWQNTQPCDYLPLEAELRAIEARRK